jgi:hypothetical protein
MNAKIILAAICFALFATQANAADTCTIREYNALGSAHGLTAQIAQEPGLADQVSADFTSAPVQSSLFQPGTNLIKVVCNVNASYLVGSNPSASASTNMYFVSGLPEYVGVPIGGLNKISFAVHP